MAVTLFYIILAIVVADFVFEQYLDLLNFKSGKGELPEELKGIYDEEKYKKQQDYEGVTYRFGLITSTFSFVVIALMLLLQGFAFVDHYARTIAENPVWLALLFFGLLMLAQDILSTPFSVYDTFVIEEKFGFNKTTALTFILDKLKGWLLAAVIGGGLLAFIIWLYQNTMEMFWIYAWVMVSFFSIFMTMFYSSIIVPLFNKQTPLEDGELKNAIQQFSHKAGFKLDNIFVIDGSKRSSKANAYFSGLGSKKRIVLFDTLIKDLSTNEIVAVLAHEIGHYKKKHTLLSIAISIVQNGITFYILSLFIGSPVLSEALSAYPSFHIGLIAFGILYSPLSTLVGLGLNVISRQNEYSADRFAADFGFGNELVSALKKLSINNLSNLTPHPLYVFFHYSHPTLLQRINALN